MFESSDPRIYWLSVTNIVLGLVTLVCLVALIRGVLLDLWERIRGQATSADPADDHAFFEPRLGLTMPDGGERVERNNA